MSQLTPSVSQTFSRLIGNEKIRFGLVGIVNTLVDFAVFLTLSTLLSLSPIIANVVSTSCALAVSYLLNKKAVFGNADTNNRRQIILFIIVTLSALWIIQPIVIVAVTNSLPQLFSGLSMTWLLVIGKVIATIITLVWNYIWYSRVVFRSKTQ